MRLSVGKRFFLSISEAEFVGMKTGTDSENRLELCLAIASSVHEVYASWHACIPAK